MILHLYIFFFLKMTLRNQNQTIVNNHNSHKQNKRKTIMETLGRKFPNISESKLLSINDLSVSCHQSLKQGNGQWLENSIAIFLDKYSIIYYRQVTINQEGTIIGFNIKTKCHHIIDFVISSYPIIGRNIDKFMVISCKTSCREPMDTRQLDFIAPPQPCTFWRRYHKTILRAENSMNHI